MASMPLRVKNLRPDLEHRHGMDHRVRPGDDPGVGQFHRAYPTFRAHRNPAPSKAIEPTFVDRHRLDHFSLHTKIVSLEQIAKAVAVDQVDGSVSVARIVAGLCRTALPRTDL
ncbi:hypothetical protein [Roseibium marinum]|uniref:hypothetical protein n=1 Tax=Roseibium marinum TaxID=281252 RepID=UPI0011AEE0F4|nr:hypothetical protein [Roseibium marinum]